MYAKSEYGGLAARCDGFRNEDLAALATGCQAKRRFAKRTQFVEASASTSRVPRGPPSPARGVGGARVHVLRNEANLRTPVRRPAKRVLAKQTQFGLERAAKRGGGQAARQALLRNKPNLVAE